MIGDEIDHPHDHGGLDCDAHVIITGSDRFGTIRYGRCELTGGEVEPWHR